jgi:hypothetical protein
VDIVPKALVAVVIAPVTKAVLAAVVFDVPAVWFGTVTVPVNVGDTEEIAPENAAVLAVKAPVKAVVPVTERLPLTV